MKNMLKVVCEKKDNFKCPICKKLQGDVLTGNMPNGTMKWYTSNNKIAGFNNCGTINCSYSFPRGYYYPDDNKVRVAHAGVSRKFFLPNNKLG